MRAGTAERGVEVVVGWEKVSVKLIPKAVWSRVSISKSVTRTRAYGARAFESFQVGLYGERVLDSNVRRFGLAKR